MQASTAGLKIPLPDGAAPLPAQPWQGSFYWWGGKADLANGMMTTKNPIALPAGSAITLTFDLLYDIEPEWDFLWIQTSEDGATWKTLTNTHTSCVHDSGWIGGLYGFPDDLCGAGLGGFTGYNSAPASEIFDLSAYAGKSIWLRFWYMTDWGTTGAGPFVDMVQVTSGASTIFSDNAESRRRQVDVRCAVAAKQRYTTVHAQLLSAMAQRQQERRLRRVVG